MGFSSSYSLLLPLENIYWTVVWKRQSMQQCCLWLRWQGLGCCQTGNSPNWGQLKYYLSWPWFWITSCNGKSIPHTRHCSVVNMYFYCRLFSTAFQLPFATHPIQLCRQVSASYLNSDIQMSCLRKSATTICAHGLWITLNLKDWRARYHWLIQVLAFFMRWSEFSRDPNRG